MTESKSDIPATENNNENYWVPIRGEIGMIDSDLAALYGVNTKGLIQTVKRNIDCFPYAFMFQLSMDEYNNLRSQNITSSWGGR